MPDSACSPSPHCDSLTWRSALVILLFGGSLLLLGLGGSRVLTSHEVVFAQPAREMITSGDWLIPTIAGVPVTEKPPLTYWVVAVFMLVFQGDGEWIVRLPSVLAALATALLTAGFAARWFGNRLGLTAGLVHVTMYYVLQGSRYAESDMLLVAAVAAAMFCFGLAAVDSPHGRRTDRWLPWAYYFAAGCAFLIKGLIGPVVVFSGSVLYLLLQRDWRGFKFFLSPTGLLLFAFCTLAWPVAACLAYPPFWDDQVMHHFGRFRGDLGGSKPFFFYLYGMPLAALPWTPLVVWAVVRGWRSGVQRQPLWRFAACWILPGFTLLTASAWKHQHYSDPLLPPLSLLAAYGLFEYLEWRYQTRRPLRALWTAASLAGCGVAILVLNILQPRGAREISILVAFLGVAFLVLIYLERQRRQAWQLGTLFATAWVVIAGAISFVLPEHDSYSEQTQFARRAGATLPAGQPLHLVHLPEYQVTYYLGVPLVRVDDPEQLKSGNRASRGEFYVFAPQYVVEGLSRFGSVKVLDRCPTIRPKVMQEKDRLTLARLTVSTTTRASAQAAKNDGSRSR